LGEAKVGEFHEKLKIRPDAEGGEQVAGLGVALSEKRNPEINGEVKILADFAAGAGAKTGERVAGLLLGKLIEGQVPPYLSLSISLSASLALSLSLSIDR
jgi:hypothetical protein